jgi:hypothetical protein
MPIIQCLAGAVTESVGGQPYSFQFDKHGRAVANVTNLVHAECFLSVTAHYRKVEPAAPPQPTPEPTGEDDQRPDDHHEGAAEATAPAGEPLEDTPGDEETPANPNDLSNEQLRAAIEEKTGDAPHPNTGRKKLLVLYNAALDAD